MSESPMPKRSEQTSPVSPQVTEEPSGQAPAEQTEEKKPPIKSARHFTLYLFIAVLVIWVYTLWADRVTPMTDQGRVNGQLIRISPQVSAPIANIEVANNARVTKDQPLLQLDPAQFKLKVTAAKTNLQQTTQSVGANATGLEEAKANEVAARVKLNNARQHFERNQVLARTGVVSQQTLDDSQANVSAALAQLAQATAALAKAKQALGPTGEDNPQLQAAINQLDQALLNLSYTKINAPGGGVITNMDLAPGDFAAAGQPLLTFIDQEHLWLTAMVTEGSLAYLKQGTPVKIIFDAYPGEIYTGKVQSIGWGSSGNGGLQIDNSTGLLTSNNSLLHAQRFPVNINFDSLPPQVQLRYGGRATVSFYPGKSDIGESLMNIWTWAWSYLTYVS